MTDEKVSYFEVAGAFFSGVLVIESDVYAVEEITTAELWAEGGPRFLFRYFVVSKCGELEDMADEQGGLYLVTIPTAPTGYADRKPSCRCFGYNRWQHCKHIDALTKRVKGEL